MSPGHKHPLPGVGQLWGRHVSGGTRGVVRGTAEVATRGRNLRGTARVGRGATGSSNPRGISGAG
jgi:hypothetical protein